VLLSMRQGRDFHSTLIDVGPPGVVFKVFNIVDTTRLDGNDGHMI